MERFLGFFNPFSPYRATHASAAHFTITIIVLENVKVLIEFRQDHSIQRVARHVKVAPSEYGPGSKSKVSSIKYTSAVPFPGGLFKVPVWREPGKTV